MGRGFKYHIPHRHENTVLCVFKVNRYGRIKNILKEAREKRPMMDKEKAVDQAISQI